MSSISTYLEYIQTKKWASEVRTAIINAIRECYNNTEDPELRTEALEAAIQEKIDAGQMAALTIGDGTITAAKLANEIITTAKIADGAITQDKLANGSVTAEKLDPNMELVAVDPTLSNAGEAADAKATGDAISELNGSLGTLEENLSYKVSSVNGVKPNQDGDVTDLINYIRLNVYNPDDENVYVGGMLKGDNAGYTANANWMVTGYIPVEPGVEYFLYQVGDKYSRRMAAYYDANKIWLSDYNFYNVPSDKFIPPEGAAYIRITIIKSSKDSMRVYRESERYTYLLDAKNGGVTNILYQQLYPISVTDEFTKAGRMALEQDFKEAIHPENTDFLTVVGRYNILDYDNASKNVRWSDSEIFGKIVNSGRVAYSIIRLPLSADPITLHGGNLVSIRLNSAKDGATLLSFSVGTLPYGDTPSGFTITSSGITDIVTQQETEIADIQFEEPLSEVLLFVSGGGSEAWMSYMAGVNEYHPYAEKKVLIADNCKSSIVKQIFAESDDLSAQIKTIAKPLNGKILVMFGDSEMQYLSNYPEHIQAYKDYLGISQYRSYAIAGKKWETEESDTETDPTLVTTSIHAQLNSLLSDIENDIISRDDIGAICWMMGTNCRAVGNIWVSEGSELNYNIQNMCGAANLFFKRLYTEFTDPNIRLMGIIPLQSQYRNDYFNSGIKDRNDKLRTIHQIWSMPYLDGHREFNVLATGNLVDNGTQNDNVHWSPLGMKLAIRKICGKLVTV